MADIAYPAGAVRDHWGRRNAYDVFVANDEEERPDNYAECSGTHQTEWWHWDDLHHCEYDADYCLECGPCAHPECHYGG